MTLLSKYLQIHDNCIAIHRWENTASAHNIRMPNARQQPMLPPRLLARPPPLVEKLYRHLAAGQQLLTPPHNAEAAAAQLLQLNILIFKVCADNRGRFGRHYAAAVEDCGGVTTARLVPHVNVGGVGDVDKGNGEGWGGKGGLWIWRATAWGVGHYPETIGFT